MIVPASWTMLKDELRPYETSIRQSYNLTAVLVVIGFDLSLEFA